MNFSKSSLLTILGIACALIVGCGDQQDKRLSNADVACLKLLQAGQACAGGTAAAAGTTTVTATATQTVTNTTIVK
jgi:hypothetical protein